jgi:hypothetical protein
MPRPDHTKDIAFVRWGTAEGGLRCEAYPPPGLAEWAIGLVEQGVFHSPSEAVFVAMKSFREAVANSPDHKPAQKVQCEGFWCYAHCPALWRSHQNFLAFG